jgi:V/A-type H+-transporting ATPase subunit C
VSDGFEYGNARVRARRGELLKQAGYRELAVLDTDRLLAALSDTPYRPDLVVATPRYRGTRLCFEALRTNLARTLRELAGWYEGPAARPVKWAVGRWDLRNVRTILRGQYARVDPDEIRVALVPAGGLGDDILSELASQPGIRPTVELMVSWGVPTPAIARAVSGALRTFELSGNLEAIERALDRATVAELLAALGDAEHEVARVLRAQIDHVNLLVALRLNKARSEGQDWDALDPAERFLGGGGVPVTMLARVARAEDRPAAIAVLAETSVPASWRPAIERWSESGNVVAFGDELDEILTRMAVGMFATADPLGPGVPVAYVWAKENEVANLRTIGAAIAAGLSPEDIEKDLVIL